MIFNDVVPDITCEKKSCLINVTLILLIFAINLCAVKQTIRGYINRRLTGSRLDKNIELYRFLVFYVKLLV